ncbi:MAG: prephenate dehydrogenase/arogenate dehydrogenase family protein [Planctomycetes bacterium]|nr:prephenate dehydrogenase/arogenate dehydrogenase family protein [Planctomycetota bacterium]
MSADDLDTPRAEIAATDRELVRLLARRMELSGRIGAIKAERGLGVSVQAIEEQVLARARDAAAACGVSAAAMEAIFRAIVQASVERQHKTGIERLQRGGGRVLLVGAAGKLGRWFAALFETAGHDVVGVDPVFAAEPRGSASATRGAGSGPDAAHPAERTSTRDIDRSRDATYATEHLSTRDADATGRTPRADEQDLDASAASLRGRDAAPAAFDARAGGPGIAPGADDARARRAATAFTRLADVPDLDAFDWILVATPLGATPAVLDELVLRAPRRATIVEVSSIKAALEPALERARRAGVSVLCLHPMFGPGKSAWGPLTFALAVRADEAREVELVRALLAHPYARVVAMPFAEHDRRMGWLLGLAHLSGMLFASALARSGLDAAELESTASTTYARQKATALSILGEDPALYLDIQRLNPHREAVYAAVADALAELAQLVRDGDREAFARCLARAREAIGSGG